MFFFFFNDTATTEIYTLSLHDALPISARPFLRRRWRWSDRLLRLLGRRRGGGRRGLRRRLHRAFHGARIDHGCFDRDRKSTRLNSSHRQILYGVFFFKKKKNRT